MRRTKKPASPTHAEDMPYWDTPTTLASNQDYIERELRKFGAAGSRFTITRVAGSTEWVIQFEHKGRLYQMKFAPWPTRSTGRGKEEPGERAVRQMAARAHHEIKALLIAAAFEPELEIPHALVGYLAVEDRNGQMQILGDAVASQLEQYSYRLALPSGEKR